MREGRDGARGGGTGAWIPALQALFTVYGLAFIWNTSFLIGSTRFFCLFDDAMISMRYARNFAHGCGLLWNPGQPPVEGITNFLWTMLMVPWHLLPVPLNLAALPVQLTSLLCLVLALRPLSRIAMRVSGGRPAAAVFAMVCSAFYLPLVNWSLLGMETGLLALLLCLACDAALEDLDAGRLGARPYAWLLLASLVRVDALVPLLALGLLLAALDPLRRRQRLLVAFGLTAAMGLLQCGARLWYYGVPFPNTYYLKMTGFPMGLRLLRGLWVGRNFLLSLGWVLPAALVGAWFLGGDPFLALPLGLFLTALAYSVYVGGDAWEFWGGANRFICPAMPMFFAWAGAVAARTLERWGGRLRSWPGAAALALAVLALAGATPHPRVLLLRSKTLYVEDNLALTGMGLMVRFVTLPGATAAVLSAGAIAYFSGRTCVDLLGKNDPTIAHMAMRIDLSKPIYDRFYPGHLKWDLGWSIGRLRPDVLAQTEPRDRSELRRALRGYLYSPFLHMYFRQGSRLVRWGRLGRLGRLVAPNV